MTKTTYIRCLDEGHGPVSPTPNPFDGSTALMVNPDASTSVLLDAARTRVARIVDVTKVFIELEVEDIDFAHADACRLLTTVSAMAEEVHRILTAAQEANHG